MEFSVKVVCAVLTSISSVFSADPSDPLCMSSSDKLKSTQKCLNNGKIHKSNIVLREVGDDYPKDEVELLLEKCEDAVKQRNFSEAVKQFKMVLEANGDPACFFFGDIIRILVKEGKVRFKMDGLYTDVGITDVAKTQLNELTDDVIEGALKTYYKNELLLKFN